MKERTYGNLLRFDDLENFGLSETLDCGQCFRFDADEKEGWKGVAGNYAAHLWTKENSLFIQQTNENTEESLSFWHDYFDLERDYSSIQAEWKKDEILARCIDFAPGIRVLRQPAWEALLTFIISQNNNVPRIKGIVKRLCDSFGEAIPGGERRFPTPEKLAGLTEKDLSVLRAGWRSTYLLDAAQKVALGVLPLDQIASLPLKEAREVLQIVKGVGPKVAECVLLYGMGRTEAFPMDVWMKRAMQQLFPGKMPEDFGPYAGIAQQYIFHYCRMHPTLLR